MTSEQEEIIGRRMRDQAFVDMQAYQSRVIKGARTLSKSDARPRENGVPLCTNCGKPVPRVKGSKGWRATCSEECHQARSHARKADRTTTSTRMKI